jgi:hypothetical protein
MLTLFSLCKEDFRAAQRVPTDVGSGFSKCPHTFYLPQIHCELSVSQQICLNYKPYQLAEGLPGADPSGYPRSDPGEFVAPYHILNINQR